MSKCLLSTILRVLPNTSLTSSRAFSCSKCLLANHYETLKLNPNATAKEIKQAYFKLSKENHPDLHPNDPTCHEKFIQLQEAYKVLSNAASRKEYDVRTTGRRGAYYNQDNSQRPYDDPDFSFRDEWLRKQNEKMKEMRYGEHFGRRADDPRNFNSYYSKPHNLSREEMNIFRERMQFSRFQNGMNLIILFVVMMAAVTIGESVYFKKVREDYMNESMMRRARMLESMRDPYYRDTAFWEERDKKAQQKMSEIEDRHFNDE